VLHSMHGVDPGNLFILDTRRGLPIGNIVLSRKPGSLERYSQKVAVLALSVTHTYLIDT
jgi:hypothetical protein